MNDKVKIQSVKVALLEPNKGQIEGVPRNPRFVRDKKFELLKKSIQASPGMMAVRECLVYRQGKKYVVIGGNQRFRACKELGWEEIPCKLIPDSATPEQLRAYAIKDNQAYGQDDMDMLANEWDSVVNLDDYGIDVSQWKVSEQDFDTNQELDMDDFDEEMKLTLKFTHEEREWVQKRLKEIDSSPEMAILIATGWNDNGKEEDEWTK